MLFESPSASSPPPLSSLSVSSGAAPGTNHEQLIAAGLRQIGTGGIYIFGQSAVRLGAGGQIEFLRELERGSSDDGEVRPFCVCRISYVEGLPVFELQREGRSGYGIFGLTGMSQHFPVREEMPAEMNMSIREHLVEHGFAPLAGSPDVLCLDLPGEVLGISHLGSALVAVFEHDRLVSIFAPLYHYDAERIRAYDMILSELPAAVVETFNLNSASEPAPSPEDRELWYQHMRNFSPPWDPPDTAMLEDMRQMQLQSSDRLEIENRPPQAESNQRAGAFFLFDGSSIISVLLEEAPEIASESRFFLKEPTDEQLGLRAIQPIETDGGFQIGRPNQTDVICQLTEINRVSIHALERVMRPGEASNGGFLGAHESLLEILAQDNDYVLAQGLTHQQIAWPLKRIIATALTTDNPVISVGDALIQIEQNLGFMGSQESPFNDQLQGSGDIRIRNRQTGESVWIPALLPELIDRYGFYEGKGSLYRVSPETLIRILQLKAAIV